MIIVEAWYPTNRSITDDPQAVRATFGHYFDRDPELLLRTERALLETTGFMPDVVEQHMQLAPEQFDVARGSFRDAPVADGSFPVVIYSHGTLQQRFTNDTMAENLARQGYIVLAPEHTGNDALAPLGAFCADELSRPGVMPGALAENTAKASVALVGGTPLRFYSRDAAADPIHAALSLATGGARTRFDGLTKPVTDIIGGEDSRRKATTDAAASIGVYDAPSAENPSPIVSDTFANTSAFCAMVRVADTDHFDLVDDPFVVAYRATGGISRNGAFDSSKSYVLRPLAERQQIRDHYVLATLDVFLKGASRDDRFAGEPFAERAVGLVLGGTEF